MVEPIKGRTIIHGGNFRLDRGPTQTEAETFRHALLLYDDCRTKEQQAALCCIVNDLGVHPLDRPKMTNGIAWPKEYYEIAYQVKLLPAKTQFDYVERERDVPYQSKNKGKGGVGRYLKIATRTERRFFLVHNDLEIEIFYESSLRNSASGNGRAMRKEQANGGEIATCPAIMGNFYHRLARLGYAMQIGFYAMEPKPEDDRSCSRGSLIGATPQSGYSLEIAVLNYWVIPNGQLQLGGHFEA